MKVKIVVDGDRPVRLVRMHKPRGGGGMTLGEFTNKRGRGQEQAERYARQHRHIIFGVEVDGELVPLDRAIA